MPAYVRKHGASQRELSPSGEDVLASDERWIDLVCPTPEETRRVNLLCQVDTPTFEETQEIEISSRLYKENGAAYMTLSLPLAQHGEIVHAPVTIILKEDFLITLRYADSKPFDVFLSRFAKMVHQDARPHELCFELLDAIIDHVADQLEWQNAKVENLSLIVFPRGRCRGSREVDLNKVIDDIGAEGSNTSRIRESLTWLGRMLTFLNQLTRETGMYEASKKRIKTMSMDVASLTGFAGFLSSKMEFTLDATLGLINIEQNKIIKIFTVAAVALMPPTLIASIYGMNFRHMPELGWELGYPLAIGIMVAAALLPCLYFKKRGWL